jgi:hypothetical protein
MARHPLTVLTALTALAVLEPPRPAAAGPCAVPLMVPTVFTPAGTAIPKDGGVVVLDEPGGGDLATHGAPSKWQFVHGARRMTAKISVVAPGLAVLAGTGRELHDAHDKPLVALGVGQEAPLAAPEVTAVTYRAVSGRRGTAVGVQAVFAAPPPPDRVLVVVDADGTTGRSWGVPSGGPERYVTVFASGSCTVQPTGTRVSALGDEVRLRWVDNAGRVSPPSKPIKVTAAPDSGGPGVAAPQP